MDKKLVEIVKLWIIKADNDFKTIEHELERDDPITDTICYHSQQVAEKYLKLFLVSKGIEPLKTHNILILKNECEKIDPSFTLLADIEYLTDYAVELRYPGNFYIPSLKEAREAYKDAENIKTFVLGLLKF